MTDIPVRVPGRNPASLPDVTVRCRWCGRKSEIVAAHPPDACPDCGRKPFNHDVVAYLNEGDVAIDPVDDSPPPPDYTAGAAEVAQDMGINLAALVDAKPDLPVTASDVLHAAQLLRERQSQ